MKPLIIIPARGGSKGIPGKNIKLLNGKPLIQYTIEAALEITTNENIIVSTDSPEIKIVVEKIGIKIPSLRPKKLATDTAGTYEVLLYELTQLENKGEIHDYLIFLQGTSPFRTAQHIREALELYTTDLDMVVSVKETSSNPYYVLKEENENGFLETSKKGNYKTRQECPKVWELNGSIYVINVASLKKKPISEFEKVKKYVMNDYSSHDIDTPFDWLMAETIIKHNFS